MDICFIILQKFNILLRQICATAEFLVFIGIWIIVRIDNEKKAAEPMVIKANRIIENGFGQFSQYGKRLV